MLAKTHYKIPNLTVYSAA